MKARKSSGHSIRQSPPSAHAHGYEERNIPKRARAKLGRDTPVTSAAAAKEIPMVGISRRAGRCPRVIPNSAHRPRTATPSHNPDDETGEYFPSSRPVKAARCLKAFAECPIASSRGSARFPASGQSGEVMTKRGRTDRRQFTATASPGCRVARHSRELEGMVGACEVCENARGVAARLTRATWVLRIANRNESIEPCRRD